ncbi:hypothetical protein H312_00282 [Anncaliia algerae PRA339]|uniref:Uncharacterized protein n=1 Tax=Anncaliia algerae PRA339 TaxID=1288291 RepID=A0A059F5J1_9MICR|nr:hypothetical protein H312_00282 [Anncaliia algerae PRA339]
MLIFLELLCCTQFNFASDFQESTMTTEILTYETTITQEDFNLNSSEHKHKLCIHFKDFINSIGNEKLKRYREGIRIFNQLYFQLKNTNILDEHKLMSYLKHSINSYFGRVFRNFILLNTVTSHIYKKFCWENEILQKRIHKLETRKVKTLKFYENLINDIAKRNTLFVNAIINLDALIIEYIVTNCPRKLQEVLAAAIFCGRTFSTMEEQYRKSKNVNFSFFNPLLFFYINWCLARE